MPTKKKVLLITYYWPPAGGAGVQRWLKMSKYLANHVDLTVYIPQNANYPMTDESLRSEVSENIKIISHKIQEPYALAEKINQRNGEYKKGQIEEKGQQSFLSKTSLWIRANMFIPDARAWWINPSFKYLKKYLTENQFDAIITTGPPHSVHVIGLKLKLEFEKLHWIADFRDPWTKIDYFQKLPFTKSALKKHKKLEKEVLKYADKIVTVSPTWAKELSEIGEKEVEVVFNGFDKEDFDSSVSPKDKFTITYVGSLNSDRNPSNLWGILNNMCSDNDFFNDLDLQMIGSVSESVIQEINNYPNLSKKVNFKGYLEHKKAISELQKSHILLLLINKTENEKGIIPGKFFEYLASKRKIFCIGKEGADIQEIINKTKSGVFCERENPKKMEEALRILHKKFQSGLLNKSNIQNYAPYSRKEAAFKFLKIINELN